MIRSNSLEGRSETVVEFQLNADMSRAVQDVRDKVAAVQPSFPRDAKQPYVSRFDGDNAQPTVVPVAARPGRAARASCRCSPTRSSGKRLERVDGVARVDVGGLTVRQVRIDLDPQRLRAYQLTPADVSHGAAARQRRHAGRPAHRHRRKTRSCASKARCATPRRSPTSSSRTATASSLRLADLGTLVEREREPDSISRVDGVPAISFQVFKQQDANIVETGEAIKAATEELRKTLPPGVELRLVYADSDWVKGSLDGRASTR